MSTGAQHTNAADLIWQHWQAGTVMAALPDVSRPHHRRDGYAIQARVTSKGSRPSTGWKIAATSKAGQAHIGVDGPLAGRLLGERTYQSGAMVSLTGNRMRVAEPEFAFRCGKRLEPRVAPYTPDEVLSAMDALIPAIEVPDSRFEDFAKAGAAQLVADCACARDFVLGTPTTADWRAIDLSRHRVHGSIAGRLERDGIGANVLDDPRLALTWLVNELSSLGIALEPGEIATTGTCMTPLEIQPGDHVIADFGVLGRVEARFA
jgi:2-keto-4-pentenoate hydratase